MSLTLSILIPVYNHPFKALLEGLLAEALSEGLSFEILIGNDGDVPDEQHIKVVENHHSHIRLLQHAEALGRSKNRNKLAEMARGQWLLFVDGDARLSSPSFLHDYLINSGDDAQVLCGGTLYQNEAPGERQKFLRWKYGKKREELDAGVRNLRPYCSFSSFNFMISKEVFLNIPFDETVTGYGHEDTLFGLTLRDRHIQVRHLNNGLFHDGIDMDRVFLDKVSQSVDNLARIYHLGLLSDNDISCIRLLSLGLKLTRRLPRPLLKFLGKAFRPVFLRLIRIFPGSLLYLDLYKLALLLTKL